jgi:hypothetical protein
MDATTLSITTINITILSITTLTITTFTKMKHSTMDLFATLSINDTKHI